LTRIPAEDEPFYCFDCHPTGARADALQKYLDQHMDERNSTESSNDDDSSSSWTQTGVWMEFIAKDLARIKHHSPRSAKKGGSAVDSDTFLIPRSELHNPKLWMSTNGRGGPDRPFLIGCPIRLYVPQLNDYVVGRIVDHREMNGVQQHYVRFPAGTREMKQGVTAWMVLEEHALLVNTGVVLVKPDNNQLNTSPNTQQKMSPVTSGEKRSAAQTGTTMSPQMPESPTKKRQDDNIVVATAWARTSRELLSLKKVQGLSIPFYGKDESPWNCHSPRPESLPWVLIRNYGAGDRFRFVLASRLKDFDVDLPQHASIDQAAIARAKGELLEKKRVRDWYTLQSKKRRPRGGIFKRDVDELDSVDARPRVKPFSLTVGKDVLPCMSVRPGLDRVYLAQRLGKFGYTGDAATIRCEDAQPFYEATSRRKRLE
jgi:hypothetical protein